MSHVSMGVFWSGTDTATISRFSNGDWFTSIVGNKSQQYKARIDLYSPLRLKFNVETIHPSIFKAHEDLFEYVDGLTLPKHQILTGHNTMEDEPEFYIEVSAHKKLAEYVQLAKGQSMFGICTGSCSGSEKSFYISEVRPAKQTVGASGVAPTVNEDIAGENGFWFLNCSNEFIENTIANCSDKMAVSLIVTDNNCRGRIDVMDPLLITLDEVNVKTYTVPTVGLRDRVKKEIAEKVHESKPAVSHGYGGRYYGGYGGHWDGYSGGYGNSNTTWKDEKEKAEKKNKVKTKKDKKKGNLGAYEDVRTRSGGTTYESVVQQEIDEYIAKLREKNGLKKSDNSAVETIDDEDSKDWNDVAANETEHPYSHNRYSSW